MERPIVKAFPGPKTKKILSEIKNYEHPAEWATMYEIAPVIEEASDVFVKDVDGNVYLDFTSGFAALNAGHCHPKIIEAAINQLKRVHHTAHLPTEARVLLAKKLVEIAPGDLKNNCKVIYEVGGSGAVEVALKLARGFTRRSVIVSFYGGYHGRGGMAALDVTGEAYFQKGLHAERAGVVMFPYPYCYRCYFNLEYPDCDMFCLKFLERALSDPKCGLINLEKGINFVSAVIVEPALGASGYIVPPDEFLPRLRKLCSDFDILLIDDEVQMGWARSGKMFCADTWNITPDIMILGKSITGGVFPLAATIAKNDILNVFPSNYHGVTYSGNPVGCACALAMIDIIEEEKLTERASKLGSYFLDGLRDLMSSHPLIGDVNGKGLIIGVEFVKNRETKKPAPEETKRIHSEAIKRGLIVTQSGFFGNRFNIVPPLTVKKEHLDVSLEILDDAIGSIEKGS